MVDGSGSPESTSPRWVARLTPLPGSTLDDLLHLPLGLDVWERQPYALVVAASEARLTDIERRQLAGVERIMTTAAYQRAHGPAPHHIEEGEAGP